MHVAHILDLGTPATNRIIKEHVAYKSLHSWIFVGANAYVEYTFVSSLNRNVYRGTVDLNRICLL